MNDDVTRMNDDVTYLFNGKVDGLGRDGLDERLVFRQVDVPGPHRQGLPQRLPVMATYE